ncbi:MAG: hypothetical protein LBC71_05620 [Oscillospiraceae bacterium]|nr:hypothetical protein [Oscillospiraceae bacterium]
MKKIILPILLLIIVVSVGCDNLLEDYVEFITPHETEPYVRPPDDPIIITITDADEFKELLLQLIMEHEATTTINYYSYDGENVQDILNEIAINLKSEDPIGAYAVADIQINATRIVAYFEVDIEIEFKRSKEQIDSIVNVGTSRYMTTQIQQIMSQHNDEAIIRTRMGLTKESIIELITDIYYQNPRSIVMLPFVTVEMFPEEGIDRIYEIKFIYIESADMMQLFAENLALYVRRNAERAVGDTDAEILLSLVENLMASTSFDIGAASAISVHGAQNFAATAFGALVQGNAVGEGFAMAFKALCDELGFNSIVVLGGLNDLVHAWNIIYLEGDYYHIDVSMCVENGLEIAFLKTDADFEEMGYTWDRENTVRCEGELTLDDIIIPEDPENPENPDNPQDPNNPEIPDNPENNGTNDDQTNNISEENGDEG